MELRKIGKKKGQLSLADAPTVVLLVGLVFLVMATIALVSEKYGSALPRGDTSTIVNETVDMSAGGPKRLAGAANCNPSGFSITTAINTTGTIIDSANYTVSNAGDFNNVTSEFSEAGVKLTYTVAHSGVACNVTADLQTEISNNTSIAGIVLTISLVGIVLTVLIGIFIGVRGRRV